MVAQRLKPAHQKTTLNNCCKGEAGPSWAALTLTALECCDPQQLQLGTERIQSPQLQSWSTSGLVTQVNVPAAGAALFPQLFPSPR